MGKASRDKGARNETALVNTFRGAGIPAERVPLSGQRGGLFAGDIHIPTHAGQFKIEAKLRKDAFRELYNWIDGNHAVVVRADRKEALAVIRLTDFMEFFRAWLESAGSVPAALEEQA